MDNEHCARLAACKTFNSIETDAITNLCANSPSQLCRDCGRKNMNLNGSLERFPYKLSYYSHPL